MRFRTEPNESNNLNNDFELLHMMTIPSMCEDLEFLVQLNRKVQFDNNLDTIISEADMMRLLSVLDKNDLLLPDEPRLLFYPHNTNMGFSVGFTVLDVEQSCPSVPFEKRHLLTFIEKQLPPGYDFKEMSKYFMRPRNLELASLVGIKIINDRTKHDY